MTRWRTLFGPTAAACWLATTPAFAEEPRAFGIIVDLQDDTTDSDEAELERSSGVDLKLNSVWASDERFFIADVDDARQSEVLASLRADPRVEYAEPNWEVAAFDDESETGPYLAPNDPLYSKQWSFPMIDVPSAWKSANGEGVVVAVIDTGVAFEDYKSYRRVEDLGADQFVEGYNFVDDSPHANDDHGHGTHVAGTIAQATNNGIGVAGLAPKAKIMPLKVLDRSGRGTTADIIDAIRMAADEGANVINMSLGGGMHSYAMEAAIKHAKSKGTIVIAAAGNGGRGVVEYPAAYPGSVAVSSVGPTGKLAFYSSWGKQVALAAPGGDKNIGGEAGGILQNTIYPGRPGVTNAYLSYQGTSMATPHVAGVAALVMSSGVKDPSKVETILRSTATEAGAKGWDPKYGNGILNAGRAVSAARSMVGGPTHLAAALALCALFVLRLRPRNAHNLGALGVLGAALTASGLFFLPGLGSFSAPIAALDATILGSVLGSNAIYSSALPVIALSVLLLSIERARPVLLGVALGFAAHLFVKSGLMPSDVALVPGDAGFLDRIWLVGNAAILVGFARLLALRSR